VIVGAAVKTLNLPRKPAADVAVVIEKGRCEGNGGPRSPGF
jgi:hypothetical protein